MHLPVLYIVIIWLAVLFVVSLVYMIRASSTLVRILVLDTMSLLLIALLALFTRFTQTRFNLEAALLLALFSFMGTVAAARYRQEGKLF